MKRVAEEDRTPFDSLESAHEYVGLLCEALEEARSTIRQDTEGAIQGQAERRLQALRIVDYKLNQLSEHFGATKRILNDLRTLRRLLLGERDEGT